MTSFLLLAVVLHCRFAGNDARLFSIWKEEESAAAARRDAHWKLVREKQKEAARLRASLKKAEKELTAARAAYDSAYKAWDDAPSEALLGPLRNMAMKNKDDKYAKMNTCSSRVSSLKSQLSAAERAPKPVMQPLPSNEEEGLAWLFVLHMPHMMRYDFLLNDFLRIR
jgi:hypothetical protein